MAPPGNKVIIADSKNVEETALKFFKFTHANK